MHGRHRILALAGGAALALGLAACAEDPVDEAVVVPEAEPVAVVDFDPLVPVYTLTPEQQTARDAYDMDAMQTEYTGYRDAMAGGAEMSTGTDSSMNADAANDAEAGAMASASPTGATTQAMPQRSAMDWSYLDRNSDGKLSVAEYAIWAVPVDPTEPKPNDETRPYLTSDQANKAADSFFFFDRDGDTYLSQDEFARARRGEGVA